MFMKAVGNVDLAKRADVDIIGGMLVRTRKSSHRAAIYNHRDKVSYTILPCFFYTL